MNSTQNLNQNSRWDGLCPCNTTCSGGLYRKKPPHCKRERGGSGGLYHIPPLLPRLPRLRPRLDGGLLLLLLLLLRLLLRLLLLWRLRLAPIRARIRIRSLIRFLIRTLEFENENEFQTE